MRGLKRSPWLFGLGVLLAVLVVYGGHARADVTTDQSASIIIFPKVIVDGTRDTLIQIANTDNMQANAECVYINTSGTCSITTSQACNVDTDCPTGPPAEVCVHQCTETNFTIFLTGQQPTFWQSRCGADGDSRGRCSNPSTRDSSANYPADARSPFVGELKCIEVDASGAPVAQNSLKGEAIIGGLGRRRSQRIQCGRHPGRVAPPLANIIVLDQLPGVCSGGTNDGQPARQGLIAPVEPASSAPTTGYNACPAALYMNHSGEGAVDSFTGGDCQYRAHLGPVQ